MSDAKPFTAEELADVRAAIDRRSEVGLPSVPSFERLLATLDSALQTVAESVERERIAYRDRDEAIGKMQRAEKEVLRLLKESGAFKRPGGGQRI